MMRHGTYINGFVKSWKWVRTTVPKSTSQMLRYSEEFLKFSSKRRAILRFHERSQDHSSNKNFPWFQMFLSKRRAVLRSSDTLRLRIFEIFIKVESNSEVLRLSSNKTLSSFNQSEELMIGPKTTFRIRIFQRLQKFLSMRRALLRFSGTLWFRIFEIFIRAKSNPVDPRDYL